jgi:hypothetical protein
MEFDEDIATEAEFKAVTEKNAEKKIGLFKLLIDAGAKVKVADKRGNTLLHYVVQPPNERLDYATDDGIIDLDYDTRGIHRLFSRQLIELLIANGASLSDENKNGETPLDWATQGPCYASYGGGQWGGAMGDYGGGGMGSNGFGSTTGSESSSPLSGGSVPLPSEPLLLPSGSPASALGF